MSSAVQIAPAVESVQDKGTLAPRNTPHPGTKGPDSPNPLRAVFWNVLRLCITTLAALVSSAVVARALGPSSMGLYSYALWVTGIVVALCHFGLPTAATKFIAEFMGKKNGQQARLVARKVLAAQGLIAMVMSISAALVLRHSLLKTSGLWVLAVLLVLPLVLQQTLVGILFGAQAFGRIAVCSSVTSLIQTGLVLVAWRLGGSVRQFLIALLIANIVSAVMYWVAISGAMPRVDNEQRSQSVPDTRVILRFAGPVAYFVLLDMVVWQRSEVYFLKQSFLWQEIAFYSISYLLVNRLTELLTSATSTLLPIQAFDSASGPIGVGRTHTRALCALQMAVLPMCAITSILAKPVILAIYGAAYSRVVQIILILLLSPIAITLTHVGIATVYALNKQRAIILPVTATAVVNLLLAYKLVPRWGAMGAAAANSTAQLAEGLFLILFSSHLLGARVPWNRLSRIYAAAVLTFSPAAILSANGSSIVIVVSVLTLGGAAYLALLVWQQEIQAREWKAIVAAVSIGRRSHVAID